MSRPPSSSLTLMDCAGPGSVTLAQGTWEEFALVCWFVGLVLVLDIMRCRAAKASPHLLGAPCIHQATRRHYRRRA